MAHGYSYFDSEFVPLSEYIPPLEVCIDNETCDDYTIVKVNGANRSGILLKIVQVLSDLDFIISKSYISSDGDWFTNAFYVTDFHGHKVRDSSLTTYLQRSLNVAQRQKGYSNPNQDKIIHGKKVSAYNHFSSDCAAVEITFFDRPRIFSEIIALLFEHSYFIDSGYLWTNNGHVACILYIKEQNTNRPIMDEVSLDYLGEYLANILDAHHTSGELFKLGIQNPPDCQIHTERRLHQLMKMYMDYDVETPPLLGKNYQLSLHAVMEANKKSESVDESNMVCLPQVSIENWQNRDYLVCKVKSKDRPKLLFDVVCVLTDLDYEIFHGSISSQDSVAFQEYFVRRTNGCTILNEVEKQITIQNLTAAVERRIPRGLKMELHTLDRPDLLSNVTKTLRENNLSLEKMEFAKEDDMAVGSFYITDASSFINTGNDIDQKRLDALRSAIGRGIIFENKNDCIIGLSTSKRSLFSLFQSLGRRLWSQIKRLFSIFSFV